MKFYLFVLLGLSLLLHSAYSTNISDVLHEHNAGAGRTPVRQNEVKASDEIVLYEQSMATEYPLPPAWQQTQKVPLAVGAMDSMNEKDYELSLATEYPFPMLWGQAHRVLLTVGDRLRRDGDWSHVRVLSPFALMLICVAVVGVLCLWGRRKLAPTHRGAHSSASDAQHAVLESCNV